jgi:hemerythrin-like domain-containing protein
MTSAAEATVDMRLMGVIHRALLRDLSRMEAVLAEPEVSPARRAAITEHSLWLMALLRAHEEVEDRALWPRVRSAAPEATRVLDEIERDHRAIGDLIAEVEASTRRWHSEPDAQSELHVAVGFLQGVIVPHLRRKELRALPHAARVLTTEDWQAYARTRAEGKSRGRLATEAHWAIDGASPEDVRAVELRNPVTQRLSPARWYGRRYRAAAAARWGGAPGDYRPRAAEGGQVGRSA